MRLVTPAERNTPHRKQCIQTSPVISPQSTLRRKYMQNNCPAACHVSMSCRNCKCNVCILTFDNRHEVQKFHTWCDVMRWNDIPSIRYTRLKNLGVNLYWLRPNCRLYLGESRGRQRERPWDQIDALFIDIHAMCSIDGSYILSLLLYSFCIQCYFILLPNKNMNHGQLSPIAVVHVLNLIRRPFNV